jgi:hypothetical protein
MGKIQKFRPQAQAWTETRQRYHLPHAQVEMASELGLNHASNSLRISST